MKKTFYILGSLLLFTCIFNGCQPQVDIEAAEKAVIAVNEEERDAFFAKDIIRLAEVWVQEPSSRRYFPSGKSLRVLNGWTEIKADYEEDFEAEWWDDYKDVKADFLNYVVSVNANSAVVYHDIHWTGMYLEEPFETNQNRIVYLVNHDDTWKISLIVQMTVPEEKEEVTEETAEEVQ